MKKNYCEPFTLSIPDCIQWHGQPENLVESTSVLKCLENTLDPFQNLSLNNCTTIKKTFRTLALKVHPDKTSLSDQASKILHTAYDRLRAGFCESDSKWKRGVVNCINNLGKPNNYRVSVFPDVIKVDKPWAKRLIECGNMTANTLQYESQLNKISGIVKPIDETVVDKIKQAGAIIRYAFENCLSLIFKPFIMPKGKMLIDKKWAESVARCADIEVSCKNYASHFRNLNNILDDKELKNKVSIAHDFFKKSCNQL